MSRQEYHEAMKNLSAQGWIDTTSRDAIILSFEGIMREEW